MQLSARGPLSMDTGAKEFVGRSTGTGKRVGTLIRPRSAPTFFICWKTPKVNQALRKSGFAVSLPASVAAGIMGKPSRRIGQGGKDLTLPDKSALYDPGTTDNRDLNTTIEAAYSVRSHW